MDDDYMTMTFEDDGASGSTAGRKRKPVETSLQRRVRREREGRERGRVLSKAEQARAADAQREAALGRSLLLGGRPQSSSSAAPPPPVNKGLAMMAKMGFVAGQALGRGSNGDDDDKNDKDRPIIEPIRIHVKRDRAGIGAGEEEEKEKEMEEPKKEEIDPHAYRDRIRREREEARLARQIHAAQVVAERLAGGEEGEEGEEDDKPLQEVNVLWRGMVKERRAREQERRQRIQSQKLLDRRLRGVGSKTVDTDADADSDDETKGSFLKTGVNSVVVDDDEDGDEKKKDDTDLAEFDALPPQDRLQQVVDWMRVNRRYCFWCKHTYPSADLDGCPGPTEADHD